ncbi:MAG: hypothetical protein IPK26_27365 [Planctomycetes bacterium]|nr:hypothetical protein [Planctomycetota bacterium]
MNSTLPPSDSDLSNQAETWCMVERVARLHRRYSAMFSRLSRRRRRPPLLDDLQDMVKGSFELLEALRERLAELVDGRPRRAA